MNGNLLAYQIAQSVCNSHRKKIENLARSMKTEAYLKARQLGISTYSKSGKGCKDTETWLTIGMLLESLGPLGYYLCVTGFGGKLGKLREKEFYQVTGGKK